MSPQFAELYARSERLLLEQLQYNLLFRWFVGLSRDDQVWDVTVFTKNRERLLDGEIAETFFQPVLQPARQPELLSDEHFTVEGTLLEAWANRRSFPEKKDPPTRGAAGTAGRSCCATRRRARRIRKRGCTKRVRRERPGRATGGMC
jgi:hypothetical protein